MKIVIIDDDILVTTALKTILEADGSVQVCATGMNGPEAAELYDIHQPDVLLMDIRMKGMDGLEASRRILSRHPQARILLLTTFSDDGYIVQALKAGVKGYLLKQDYTSIVPALHAVCQDQTVFGKEIISRIPDLLQKKGDFPYKDFHITEKEYELITLLADGLDNKEIAEKMYLSDGTVRNYISNILDKLGLKNRTQLAVFYYQHL